MNDVGKHIRALRKERSFSQEVLAENLHMTRQAVSQWETGHTQPDLDTLKNIGQFFDVDLLTVIYGKKQRPNLDRRLKKQHIKGLFVFGLLTVITAIVYLYLEPYFKQLSRRNFDFSYVMFLMSVRPIIYISCSLAVLHGASLLWRLQLQSVIAKRILLIVSLFVLCVYYTVPLLCALSSSVNGFLFGIAYYMANLPILFLLPGFGLFFGTQKHRSNQDNTIKPRHNERK